MLKGSKALKEPSGCGTHIGSEAWKTIDMGSNPRAIRYENQDLTTSKQEAY